FPRRPALPARRRARAAARAHALKRVSRVPVSVRVRVGPLGAVPGDRRRAYARTAEASRVGVPRLTFVPMQRSEQAARQAPLPLERIDAIGVIGVEGDVARPLCELVPKGDLLIACDRFDEELTRPDHVLGISPPTNALAALTVRPEVDDTLDLCTGNGIQA